MSDTKFHPNDDLEQRLHAGLYDYSPEAPEHLWSGIEKRLPRQRRRLVFWWWLVGVGLAGISFGTAYRFSGDRFLTTFRGWANIQEAPQPEPSSLQSLSFSSPGNNSKTARRQDLSIVSDAATKAGQGSGNDLYAEKAPLAKDFSASDSGFMPDVFVEKSQSESTFLQEKRALTVPEILPYKSISDLQNGKPALTGLYPISTRVFREKRWQIGLTAGPVWLRQPSPPSDAHQIGHAAFAEFNDGPATGLQAGVSVSYHLTPRWKLATGFNRRRTTQYSSHHATLRIIDGVCLNPNDYGPKEYEFDYELVSGSRTSQVTVRISQEDSLITMPDTEPFTLAMRTSRSSTEWVLPVTLQRTFGHGCLQGFLQAGGLLTLPGKTTMRVEHFTEQCADLCFAAGLTPTLSVQESRKASVSWLLGAGLEYKMAPSWSLTLEPIFFGNKGQTGFSAQVGLSFKL